MVWLELGLGGSGGSPSSTRFQIENRNRGSTLLKNRVPAIVGSGTETRFPKPPSSKYPVLETDSAPIEIPGYPTKCNSRLQQTCEGATHN